MARPRLLLLPRLFAAAFQTEDGGVGRAEQPQTPSNHPTSADVGVCCGMTIPFHRRSSPDFADVFECVCGMVSSVSSTHAVHQRMLVELLHCAAVY